MLCRSTCAHIPATMIYTRRTPWRARIRDRWQPLLSRYSVSLLLHLRSHRRDLRQELAQAVCDIGPRIWEKFVSTGARRSHADIHPKALAAFNDLVNDLLGERCRRNGRRVAALFSRSEMALAAQSPDAAAQQCRACSEQVPVAAPSDSQSSSDGRSSREL